MWQGRLIEDIGTGERFFLCNDGSIALCNDDFLIKLLYSFKNPEMLRGKSGRWNKETNDISEYGVEPYTKKSRYRTLAAITNDNCLLIMEPTLIAHLLPDGKLDTYITVAAYAEKHNCTAENIRRMCVNKRIPGARKIGRNWLIPKNARYPMDRRTMKYKVAHDDSYIE